MKTLTKTKLTYLIVWIFGFLMLFLSGCRTVKKEWVKENFVSTVDFTKLEKDVVFANERLKNEITQSYKTDIEEIKNSTSTKTTENESENLEISGNVEAEEGKTKSVTFGDTEIKSDGFNVTFKSTTTKETLKEFESLKNEIYKKFDSIIDKNETLESDLYELRNKFANYLSSQETEKTNKSRVVSKKQIGFGILFLIILIGVYLFLRKKFIWLP